MLAKNEVAKTNSEVLPETGDTNPKLASAAGVGFLSMALTGLWSTRKHKH